MWFFCAWFDEQIEKKNYISYKEITNCSLSYIGIALVWRWNEKKKLKSKLVPCSCSFVLHFRKEFVEQLQSKNKEPPDNTRRWKKNAHRQPIRKVLFRIFFTWFNGLCRAWNTVLTESFLNGRTKKKMKKKTTYCSLLSMKFWRGSFFRPEKFAEHKLHRRLQKWHSLTSKSAHNSNKYFNEFCVQKFFIIHKSDFLYSQNCWANSMEWDETMLLQNSKIFHLNFHPKLFVPWSEPKQKCQLNYQTK